MRNPVGQVYSKRYLQNLLQRAKSATVSIESGIQTMESKGLEEITLPTKAEDKFFAFCGAWAGISSGLNLKFSRINDGVLDLDDQGNVIRRIS